MDQIEFGERVRDLMIAAAPERQAELKGLWERYSPHFQLLNDTAGFLLEGGTYRIRVTPRTLHVIWLLGFASWRALESYGGIIWWLDQHRQPLVTSELMQIEGQAEIDAAYDRVVTKARELLTVPEPTDYAWPNEVPLPSVVNISDLSHQAVSDVTGIAAAYMFLHEMQHLKFAQDGNAPENVVDEEHKCDESARYVLLQGAHTYAASGGNTIESVLMKRTVGIAVASFVVLQLTPVKERVGTETHPPVADRLTSLINDSALPSSGNFWYYLASCLLATLRAEGRLPERVVFGTARELSLELVSRL